MSQPESSAGRARRNVLIVLGAVLALTALVLAMVLGKSSGSDDDKLAGGFHELRADEFADALVAAREKAGTWSYLETQTLNDKPAGVLEGKVSWDGKDFEFAFVAQGSETGEGEMRYVDDRWFYYQPSSSPKKPWLELTDPKAQPLVAAMAREGDPRRQLAIFEDPAAFQVVGVENVGVAVAVHYRVTVSIEKVREMTSNPVVGDAGDQQVYDVWVDDEDRIVKLVIPTDIGGVAQSTVVRTFTNYGEDVDVEVPPADQILPATFVTKEPKKSAAGN